MKTIILNTLGTILLTSLLLILALSYFDVLIK